MAFLVSILKRHMETKGQKNNRGVRQSYIRVVGIGSKDYEYSLCNHRYPNDQEMIEFHKISVEMNSEENILRIIAPKIFGYKHVKKAICCLLFGGSRKKLPDGATLRGDINILLIGDPSTAKSQFLKYVEKAAPNALYTSGKGSSAAGLTASVIRDPSSKEFRLEGGAMILADDGIVCIDEFDKMRHEDRVAIHEAMEQQTISIAKAGISAVLNSRTAVLAAANPIFGRYDDSLTPEENTDMQATILSRFDLVFNIVDRRVFTKDTKIARHVCAIQRSMLLKPEIQTENLNTLIGEDLMKRYIRYARTHCSPSMSKSAEELLIDQYIKRRAAYQFSAIKTNKSDIGITGLYDQRNENAKLVTVPVTVRQLEALIRISEAFARVTLSSEVIVAHVNQAIDLFKYEDNWESPDYISHCIQKATEQIKKVLKINQKKKKSVLIKKVCKEANIEKQFVEHALQSLANNEAVDMLAEDIILLKN
eukprot:gnl/TRDRNA2_/TRDRNA2_177853_c0_seq1.p1 gnl/TRDRNA2_/TRDRNA2_177853_c0~~gnl/TRDRNA2_/TRDRNA2_177853_c0_seq1.p1  ORF type:complete len:479 (+),score=3.65 gnl/TRDRNA2_/TRDRNA2_177853_c0_seq1:918-2354(+)